MGKKSIVTFNYNSLRFVISPKLCVSFHGPSLIMHGRLFHSVSVNSNIMSSAQKHPPFGHSGSQNDSSASIFSFQFPGFTLQLPGVMYRHT